MEYCVEGLVGAPDEAAAVRNIEIAGDFSDIEIVDERDGLDPTAFEYYIDSSGKICAGFEEEACEEDIHSGNRIFRFTAYTSDEE